jgi:hypothetical protein
VLRKRILNLFEMLEVICLGWQMAAEVW